MSTAPGSPVPISQFLTNFVRLIALGNQSFSHSFPSDFVTGLSSTAREILVTVVADGPVSVTQIGEAHHLQVRTVYSAAMSLRRYELARGVEGSGGRDRGRLRLAATLGGRRLIGTLFPGEPVDQLRIRRNACADLRSHHPSSPGVSEADKTAVLICLYLEEESPSALAVRVGVGPSQITKVLGSLRDQQLVFKRPQHARYNARITQRGARHVERSIIRPQVKAEMKQLLSISHDR